ncbi:MAG: 16S rRNA (cytosine(1402)-N(4))-methyltransferase RsmH [bacterium]|nr:16S rRNA (cytosine(1402)-N(4))-methyltransferase RsmH [bacterium]
MPKTLPKNLNFHSPVLATVAVDWLDIKQQGRYIDATLGGGGHTQEIIRRGGQVLGLDQDPEALAACPDLDQLTKVQTNFIHLGEVAREHGFQNAAGILFDLGVSQHQVEEPSRGFSWQQDGPLDMRMGTTAVTAAELINQLPEKELASIITRFGEEHQAKAIARRIVAHRPLTTTRELFSLVGRPDQGRRVFQAIRIAINDELGAVTTALPQALEVLRPGGRLVVISFHSLEDRLVKQQFAAWSSLGQGQILTAKPVLGERGSKLRAFMKKL